MFVVYRYQELEGGKNGRTAVGGAGTKQEAVAQAKAKAEKFAVNGYDEEDDYFWGRGKDGAKYRFYVEAG